MFDLPWWLFGSVPSDEEPEVPEAKVIITEEEVQSESQNCTPIKNYQTPLKENRSRIEPDERSSAENPSPNSNLPTLKAFLASVSRRSSLDHEHEKKEDRTPKSDEKNKTVSIKKKRSKKSLDRSETEVMQKSADGQDLIQEDPFFGLPSDHSDFVSANGDLNQSYNDSFELNNAVHENEGNEMREFPMFFTSFDDTTVLFNTTIRGDINVAKHSKEADIDNWVLKGNKILEQNTQAREEEGDLKNSSFKFPTPLTKRGRSKSLKRPANKSERDSVKVSKSVENVSDEPIVKRTRHTRKSAKFSTNLEKSPENASETIVKSVNEAQPTPKGKSGGSIPEFTRRLTPSRKAKAAIVSYGH